jgi:hypothetical protein
VVKEKLEEEAATLAYLAMERADPDLDNASPAAST